MCSQEAIQFWPFSDIAQYAQENALSLKDAVRDLLGQGVCPEHFKRNQGLISLQNQIRLLDMPIFIAGLGGLGGEVATHLAHLGAGKLYLCDHDVFEESNSNRQRYCSSSVMGQSKAQATAAALTQKMPWGEFQPVLQKISCDSLPPHLSDSLLLIDCLDSVSGKEMLEDMAAKAGIAWLHGSVLQHEGIACLKPDPGGTLKSLYGNQCQESGAGSVLSHVVAGTASLMTSLFVRWLANPDYSSPLLHADFSIPELDRFNMA